MELMELSTELRILIYEFLLVSDEPLRIGLNRTPWPPELTSGICCPGGKLRPMPAYPIGCLFGDKPDVCGIILRVCKTIYLEASPLLYTQNIFHFSSSTTSCELLGPFLERISSQARLLRHIIVEISGHSDRQSWSYVETSFWTFARLVEVSPAVETVCLRIDPIWLLGLHFSTRGIKVFRRINDILRRSGNIKTIALESNSSEIGGAQASYNLVDLMQPDFRAEIFDLGWKIIS
ncbi:uncharacterized protein K489DRAFT_409087 [Dissoconium aciculare CBS 342.82]|uniref:DUF7730 domain-containing protein n=1 Tax=Dissoconium aciculare CBS 342.82 TaxID=1314786 RepID=A0A6J3MD26_9PEZI|nr:uncharacterized protein K489DRAFT_409087 [Dissoconium aciculare CBS 342.82]KAF1824742.1 hypothetical protein K489DRAFT_409087 [Dissoconium aciculare CBS 342.82]